jgi:large subunit ribosomal protein L33
VVLVFSLVCCYNNSQLTDTKALRQHSAYKEGSMASKKGNRIVIKLRSTESGHTYTTLKNRKNDPNRLELRRYDPLVRRHVAYRETK